MTTHHLTAGLAERVMGWRAGPDRFITENRQWIPRWRFRPFENLQDAFRLLERAAPDDYAMHPDGRGCFTVRVRIGGRTGESRDASKPRAITCAIARALGIEVGE